MTERTASRLDRRQFVKLGGLGALSLTATASLLARQSSAAGPARAATRAVASAAAVHRRLVATDGHILLPGRDPLFVFGFVEAPVDAPVADLIGEFKGKVQGPAPILGVDKNVDLYLTLTNIGFLMRPDLDDSHTVHWHGFRNPLALFDGVPEVSIAVPANRDFPYFYRPKNDGTYMYHCHFEDTEHVQMGMDGIIFVTPAQNAGTGAVDPGKYAYDDGDGSTAYDREVALLLNEIDTRPHDLLEAVQEFVWSEYKPNYWVINSRAYPDTIKHADDSSLELDGQVRQPISSLIQANPGDRVLLRIGNLGFEQHALQCPGIRMKVVGEDATLLRGPGGADLSYYAGTLAIGPGEARDVIFQAPEFSAASGAVDSDSRGDFNRYLLRNRRYQTLTNAGTSGLGGMATEVRVYRDALPAQTAPNETFK